MKPLFFLNYFFIATLLSTAQNKTADETKIAIKTTMGTMVVKLYNTTPKHRDNFIRLVKKNYYDSLLFHRVIKDFMIQAGDPYSKHASINAPLGNGGTGYTLPAEFNPNLFHKRGVLAAAREPDNVNPKKRSSGSQFYIVQGRIFTDDELNNLEIKIQNAQKNELAINFLSKPENKPMKLKLDSLYKNHLTKEIKTFSNKIINKALTENNATLFKFSAQQREAYKTVGGSPHLDSQYTVFGEIIKGFDVLEKIVNSKTNSNDRPLKNVRILSTKIIN